MNVVIGMAGLVLAFWYAASSHEGGTFLGVIHLPALVLVAVGPACVALISYTPEQLRDSVLHLVRAIRFSPARSRTLLYEELSRFAVEVRAHRPAAALEVADSAEHELVRQIAPLLVKQYDSDALEQTAATASQCLSSALRRSETVLTSLARIAPAMGLIGTVLGLVKLLRDLADFSRLGPSMALALLCTLYGLLLANGVFQPLSRRLHTWNSVVVEEARLLTRALLLIREGRPMADIRALFDSARGAEANEVVAPVPGGGAV
jgi:chemotaxis protein MotA